MITHIYFIGIIVFMCFAALIVPQQDTKMTAGFALTWPITIVLIVIVLVLDLMQIEWDIMGGNKLFGFRRPKDGWPGFGITIFKTEFQFWKRRK